MSDWLIVVAAFAVMEPVAYLAHRFVMHGFGMGWHRSHHQARVSRFEKNDLYPVTMAGLTVLAMAAATTFPSVDALLPTGAGVTAYGFAYLFVHDVYIHRRLPFFTAVIGPLERLREAHRIHHLWSAEPYGFLFPVVPSELKVRAATVERDPLAVSA
jgi:beta-carotene 3-hydroxylase